MGPFAFVNWRLVNERFCALMWVIAAVLAIVVLMHVSGTAAGTGVHHGADTTVPNR